MSENVRASAVVRNQEHNYAASLYCRGPRATVEDSHATEIVTTVRCLYLDQGTFRAELLKHIFH